MPYVQYGCVVPSVAVKPHMLRSVGKKILYMQSTGYFSCKFVFNALKWIFQWDLIFIILDVFKKIQQPCLNKISALKFRGSMCHYDMKIPLKEQPVHKWKREVHGLYSQCVSSDLTCNVFMSSFWRLFCCCILWNLVQPSRRWHNLILYPGMMFKVKSSCSRTMHHVMHW